MLSIFPTNLDFLSFEEGTDREGNWKPRVGIRSSVQCSRMDRVDFGVFVLTRSPFLSV